MTEDSTRLGFLLNERDTELLLIACQISGRDPYDLVAEAIEKWHLIYTREI